MGYLCGKGPSRASTSGKTYPAIFSKEPVHRYSHARPTRDAQNFVLTRSILVGHCSLLADLIRPDSWLDLTQEQPSRRHEYGYSTEFQAKFVRSPLIRCVTLFEVWCRQSGYSSSCSFLRICKKWQTMCIKHRSTRDMLVSFPC